MSKVNIIIIQQYYSVLDSSIFFHYTFSFHFIFPVDDKIIEFWSEYFHTGIDPRRKMKSIATIFRIDVHITNVQKGASLKHWGVSCFVFASLIYFYSFSFCSTPPKQDPFLQ